MRWKLSLLLVALSMLIVACGDRVTPSASDTTPPVITWEIRDVRSGATTTLSGGATVSHTVAFPGRYTFMMRAEDSGGIRRTQLSMSTGWTCARGDIARSVGPGLVEPHETIWTPDDDGLVPGFAIEADNLILASQCNEDETFVGGESTLRGEAENYAGLTTSSTLIVTIAP